MNNVSNNKGVIRKTIKFDDFEKLSKENVSLKHTLSKLYADLNEKIEEIGMFKLMVNEDIALKRKMLLQDDLLKALTNENETKAKELTEVELSVADLKTNLEESDNQKLSLIKKLRLKENEIHELKAQQIYIRSSKEASIEGLGEQIAELNKTIQMQDTRINQLMKASQNISPVPKIATQRVYPAVTKVLSHVIQNQPNITHKSTDPHHKSNKQITVGKTMANIAKESNPVSKPSAPKNNYSETFPVEFNWMTDNSNLNRIMDVTNHTFSEEEVMKVYLKLFKNADATVTYFLGMDN
uniref:Monopolin complex subunit pcs1 n=1 Tax=Rhabditophanes sp. KR3021 TaxID=114890 RepID=A0AC35U2T8_9BILA